MTDSASSQTTVRRDTDLASRQRMLGYTLLAFAAFCADVILISQVASGVLYVAVVAAALRTQSRPCIVRITLLCSGFALASLGLDEGLGLSRQSLTYYGGTVAVMWLLAASVVRPPAPPAPVAAEVAHGERGESPVSDLTGFEPVEAETPAQVHVR